MSGKISEQKIYWDKVAGQKKFTLQADFHLVKSCLRKNDLIVDYGCGYGRSLAAFYQKGYCNSLGLDFSEAMINRGRKTFPYLNLQVIEHKHTNLPDNSVDMLLLFALLTCVTENEEQKTLMQEVWRVIRPGGCVYVIDFLLNEDERNKNRYQSCVEKYGVYGVFDLPEGAVLRHHDEKYLKRLMKDFNIVYFDKKQFETMNGHVSNGFSLLAIKN